MLSLPDADLLGVGEDAGSVRAISPGLAQAGGDKQFGIAASGSGWSAAVQRATLGQALPQDISLGEFMPLDRGSASAPRAAALTASQPEEAAVALLRFDGQPLGTDNWQSEAVDLSELIALASAGGSDGAKASYTRSGGLRSSTLARAGAAPDGLADNASDRMIAAANPSIEIANALGVDGMATRLGRVLQAKGLPVHRLSNADRFGERRTKIYYRSGWRAYAMGLASLLPTDVTLVSVGAGVSDIRIELGGDLLQFDRQLASTGDTRNDDPAG